MRVPQFQPDTSVCEACEQYIPTRVVMGMAANGDASAPIYLCENCGPIELDLMQLCRELTIGCTEN